MLHDLANSAASHQLLLPPSFMMIGTAPATQRLLRQLRGSGAAAATASLLENFQSRHCTSWQLLAEKDPPHMHYGID